MYVSSGFTCKQSYTLTAMDHGVLVDLVRVIGIKKSNTGGGVSQK